MARNFGEMLDNGKYVAFQNLMYHRRISDFRLDFWAVADRFNHLRELSDKVTAKKQSDLQKEIESKVESKEDSLLIKKIRSLGQV